AGDRQTEWSLEKKGGKGLFTSELEHTLLQGGADIAVHSSKDLPGEMPAGLAIAGYLPRADTRDVLVLRGGVYRTGGLVLNQGITLQPHADEQPVLKGTRVATEWEALRDGVWRTRWSTLFPQKPADWWRRNREGMRTPLHRFNNDMVFVDGRSLLSAGWEGELDADTFYIDYEGGWVYLGADPAGKVVEITAHDSALVRTTGEVHGKKSDKKGYTLRGLTFTQYAYRALEVEGYEPDGPADESKFGKDVVGTTLEHVTITHCSRVAGYFRGDHTVFRNCLVSDTSTEGLYLISSNDCLFERNIIARNNVEGITGYYPSAVKIFNQTHRVVCRDNLVIEQKNSSGIWYDVGNCDGVFINNWLEDCQDGFFYEISQRAICAGNIFVNCFRGVYVLNSSDVHIYHNTFVNSQATFERNERSAVGDHFGWHPATGPDVAERDGHIFVGNVVAADPGHASALLSFNQRKALIEKLTAPQVSRLEGNVYVRALPAGATSAPAPLITWAPVDTTTLERTFASVDEFRGAYSQYESGSRLLTVDLGSVFKSPVLRRLELTQPPTIEAKTPADVLKLLSWSEADARTPGAYPAKR
ncbi:MAG: right-handed parallel beta-helix repeat-containing protein, partial [Opitutaceae bacterium]|nr:right-handed parallel beta-helix repeat-containing protein [Opitutaceae bacterium]